MLRPRGLRAAVIQMLYWTYSPFLCQQSKLHSVWPDPHTLTGNICMRQTYSDHFYYFKFKNTSKETVIDNDANMNYTTFDAGNEDAFEEPQMNLLHSYPTFITTQKK